MLGCLIRKIGCLIVLIIAAITIWIYFKKPEVITGVVDKVFGKRSTIESAASDWQPLTEQGARKGEQAIESLKDSQGPAYVNLSAGDAASYIFLKAAKQLPSSAQGAAAKLDGDRLLVKADIAIGEYAKNVVGQLAAFLPERDTLVLGGRLMVSEPGKGEFQVTDVQFGKISVPKAMIPKLVEKLRKNTPPSDSISGDMLPVKLPAQIGDMRVANNQIILYKAQ